jgi:hypothetical protein
VRQEARRWTEEETALLKQRKAEGVKHKVIAFELGRSMFAVAERWRWLNSSEEIKQNRRRVQRLSQSGIITRSPRELPRDVLAERNHRLSLPLTIGQIVLGDPPPGYSALDRKLGAHA